MSNLNYILVCTVYNNTGNINYLIFLTTFCNYHCRNAFHKESKTCIPQERAFDIPSYVLKYTMNGQVWPQGDELYHEGIDVPTLLVHGRDDHLVSVEEEQGMIEVSIDDIQGSSHKSTK